MVTDGSYVCGQHSVLYKPIKAACCTPATHVTRCVNNTHITKLKLIRKPQETPSFRYYFAIKVITVKGLAVMGKKIIPKSFSCFETFTNRRPNYGTSPQVCKLILFLVYVHSSIHPSIYPTNTDLKCTVGQSQALKDMGLSWSSHLLYFQSCLHCLFGSYLLVILEVLCFFPVNPKFVWCKEKAHTIRKVLAFRSYRLLIHSFISLDVPLSCE